MSVCLFVYVGNRITFGSLDVGFYFSHRLSGVSRGNVSPESLHSEPVSSLGLVSPGAATDGVTPFFPEKLTLFSHRPSSQLPPFYVVSPLCSSVFFSKFGENFLFGCQPSEAVTRGGPPVTPLQRTHIMLVVCGVGVYYQTRTA